MAGDGIGASRGFQKALEASSGSLVIPLSDDDWLAPHAVEALVTVMGDDYDVVLGRTLVVSPGNTRMKEMGGAVLWRRQLTDRIGGFNPDFPFAADTELYARFTMSGARIGYCSEPLYFQTEHAEHGSFVHAGELALELATIEKLFPDAYDFIRGIVEQA